MATPYVFISYAHKDDAHVMPAVRALQEQGISLWYDSGIEAGSEWPEYVAEKVMNCAKFVLFISNAYLQSQNCKRELNFAISRKKEILSIFLENVVLTPGMEMQLGTYQALFCNRFPHRDNFLSTLVKEPFFNSCKAAPQPVQPQPVPAPDAQPVNYQANYRTNPQPVNNQPSARQATYQIPNYNATYQTPVQPAPAQLPRKSKQLAAILALLLGGFGVHKFYLGKPLWGVLYLCFCWTYVPAILGLIDFIILLVQNNETFAQKYNCTPE